MVDDNTRRRFLINGGTVGTLVLAGCATFDTGDDMDPTDTADEMRTGMDTTEPGDGMGMGGTATDGGMGGVSDPATAPRVSIDRFSESAGTLQVRTDESGLPRPDEPIDFDQAPFITHGLGPDGSPVSYYNFDVQPTTPAPIYAFFREDEETPVNGQLNVIDAIPGDDGYNDFWHVHKVTVPADYEANTITSADKLMAAEYEVTATTTIKNCPVVPAGSTATMRYDDGEAGLVDGWYRDQVVSYFLFEEASLTIANDAVPVSPIYVTFNTNPGEPDGGPVSGFMTEMDSDRTHNVVATVPDDEEYSPLWLVSIYDNADFMAVTDLDTATDATILESGAATVNCPIVAGGMM